jgi:hypothetical protein
VHHEIHVVVEEKSLFLEHTCSGSFVHRGDLGAWAEKLLSDVRKDYHSSSHLAGLDTCSGS